MRVVEMFKETPMSVPIMIASFLIGLAIVFESISDSYRTDEVTSSAGAKNLYEVYHNSQVRNRFYARTYGTIGAILCSSGILILRRFWDESDWRLVPVIMAICYAVQLLIMI